MDPYRDDFYQVPELYELEYADYLDDLEFYGRLARRAGRVIELGAGTGRVTQAMAERGAEVIAIDASRPMLARLRANLRRLGLLGRVTPMARDFKDLSDLAKVPLVVLPFNGLHHVYTASALLQLSVAIQGVLEPGGHFVTDLVIPDPRFFHQDEDGVFEVRFFKDPDGGRMKTWENGFYDPITQLNTVRYHYRRASGRYQVVTVPLRMYYPQEIMGLLELAGWIIESADSDFDGEPLHKGATRLVLTLRKPS
jgi:SAM-dependent methyltransferase